MCSGRMPGDMDPFGIAMIFGDVVIDPRQRFGAVLDKGRETHPGIFSVVRDNDNKILIREGRAHKPIIVLCPIGPAAAVEKYDHI